MYFITGYHSKTLIKLFKKVLKDFKDKNFILSIHNLYKFLNGRSIVFSKTIFLMIFFSNQKRKKIKKYLILFFKIYKKINNLNKNLQYFNNFYGYFCKNMLKISLYIKIILPYQ